jgi:hypothetical protein
MHAARGVVAMSADFYGGNIPAGPNRSKKILVPIDKKLVKAERAN